MNFDCCPCLFWWKDSRSGYQQVPEDEINIDFSNNTGAAKIVPTTPVSLITSPPKTPSVPTYIPITPQTLATVNGEANTSNTPSARTPMTTTERNSPKPPSANGSETNVFRQIPDKKDCEKDFDLEAPIFKGSIVQQKFFNKSTYDPKYVWVNVSARSLCLSEHTTKERRHKEANLADVTGVIAGSPEKYRATTNSHGESIPINADLCLSIKFVRGGGIDLQFQTVGERDLWYETIIRLIAQEREYRRNATMIGNTGSTK